jgi:hypothetical protein
MCFLSLKLKKKLSSKIFVWGAYSFKECHTQRPNRKPSLALRSLVRSARALVRSPYRVKLRALQPVRSRIVTRRKATSRLVNRSVAWLRCAHPGCKPNQAIGATEYCARHGGGKPCAEEECDRVARGATEYCARHGGGKRCAHKGCTYAARGATDFCVGHGGGKRCLLASKRIRAASTAR